MQSLNDLKQFKKNHPFFVAIDSDGCVFDTMEIKHKRCFAPALVEVFQLQAIGEQVERDWNQINLYSRYRGINRFMGLGMILEHLKGPYPDLIPDVKGYQAWLNENPHSMTSLQKAIQERPTPVLELSYQWSKLSSERIARSIAHLAPFQNSRACIKEIHGQSDCLVSSSSTQESLIKEWGENGLNNYVQLIAGQEMGKKKDHLKLSTQSRYAPQNMLMIGDAPGDHRAAEEIGALFFPILAGKEEESWKNLWDTGMGRFFSGTFEGTYQEGLLKAFYENLPVWEG